MAPIRRYLRISPYTVLEVRIYLDNPSLQSWLLSPRTSILPRIISSIRPLVLPKLREEIDRSLFKKGKGKKGKGVRDVVIEDDFEVAVYLMQGGSRHGVLRKVKTFKEKKEQLGKEVDINAITGNTAETAVEIDDGVAVLQEDEEEGLQGLRLDDIPPAAPEAPTEVEDEAEGDESQPRRSKRARKESLDSTDGLFVPDSPSSPAAKRARSTTILSDTEDAALDGAAGDDKKKLGMRTTYDGYSIYGRVLCLIVKRRGTAHLGPSGAKVTGGQANMENWIASTQAPAEIED